MREIGWSAATLPLTVPNLLNSWSPVRLFDSRRYLITCGPNTRPTKKRPPEYCGAPPGRKK
jgi:hypothetical protein